MRVSYYYFEVLVNGQPSECGSKFFHKEFQCHDISLLGDRNSAQKFRERIGKGNKFSISISSTRKIRHKILQIENQIRIVVKSF